MATTFSDTTRVRASSSQVSSRLGDEAVLLNFDEGIYYGLNDVSARIMEMLAETRTVNEIVEGILQEYDVDEQQCRADVVQLLTELEKHKLIDVE
jgi:hypothetical protein